MNQIWTADQNDTDDVLMVQYRNESSKTTKTPRANRSSFGRRRGSSPQQFNGIHRRRCKKIRW